MKKILTFLLCLGFAFSLVACGGDNGTSEETSSSIANEQNSESGSNEKETSFFTVTAEYDYDVHIQGEPYMLYGYYLPFFDVPSEHGAVVAGDVFTIEYTGTLIRNDIYPGEAYLTAGGEIVSVTVQKAKSVYLIRVLEESVAEEGESPSWMYYLYNDGVIGDEVKVASAPQYYLTNENGEMAYAELPYNDIVLYGTYSAVDGYSETDGYRLSGLYAWNVRAE